MGREHWGKTTELGIKLSAAWPLIFMQVASGKNCFHRPHPGFFQREISQAVSEQLPTDEMGGISHQDLGASGELH